MNTQDLASCIDHTCLRPEAPASTIRRLCEEAVAHHMATVCVLPHAVRPARAHLDSLLPASANVGLCTVIGFPLGANRTSIKAAETTLALSEGATEVDMVINLAAAIEGDWETVGADIRAVVHAAGDHPVKVILETASLTEAQKVHGALLAVREGAAFVKTSTGFGKGGATVEDVTLLRRTVGDTAKVKASGGIRTRQEAEAMMAAGADRLGTSQSVTILGES